MFEGFETKVVDVDGIAIACVVGGAGLPVLLLHGFPLPSPKPTRLLQLFVPRLCAGSARLDAVARISALPCHRPRPRRTDRAPPGA
jgi:hypothetical protein